MSRPLQVPMDDKRLQLLLQDAEDHLRQMTCRQRYERATNRIPDARRNIRAGDERLDAA